MEREQSRESQPERVFVAVVATPHHCVVTGAHPTARPLLVWPSPTPLFASEFQPSKLYSSMQFVPYRGVLPHKKEETA